MGRGTPRSVGRQPENRALPGVKAAAQLLLRHADRTGAASDPIQHRALATIDRQVTKLGHLVVQLLETVRAQAGELALDRTESDLVEIVRGLHEDGDDDASVVDVFRRAAGKAGKLLRISLLTGLGIGIGLIVGGLGGALGPSLRR